MNFTIVIGLILATGFLAGIWIGYKVIHHEDISTDRVTDQIGLALALIAVLLFLSYLPEFFSS